MAGGVEVSAVTYHFAIQREQMISTNQRLHWAVKARLTEHLRALGAWKARSVGMRLDPPVRLRIHLTYPDARQRDAENYALTIKPLVDGIVTDAGLLPGDDDQKIVERVWTSEIHRIGAFGVGLTFEEVGR